MTTNYDRERNILLYKERTALDKIKDKHKWILYVLIFCLLLVVFLLVIVGMMVMHGDDQKLIIYAVMFGIILVVAVILAILFFTQQIVLARFHNKAEKSLHEQLGIDLKEIL